MTKYADMIPNIDVKIITKKRIVSEFIKYSKNQLCSENKKLKFSVVELEIIEIRGIIAIREIINTKE